MSLGKHKPNQNQDDSDDSSVYLNLGLIDIDISKEAQQSYSWVQKPQNYYRVLAGCGAIFGISFYNGENNISSLVMKWAIFVLSDIVSMMFCDSLVARNYVAENQEEHIRLPTTAFLYYLVTNRSLDIYNINNSAGEEAILSAISSYAVGYALLTESPQTKSSNTKSKKN